MINFTRLHITKNLAIKVLAYFPQLRRNSGRILSDSRPFLGITSLKAVNISWLAKDRACWVSVICNLRVLRCFFTCIVCALSLGVLDVMWNVTEWEIFVVGWNFPVKAFLTETILFGLMFERPYFLPSRTTRNRAWFCRALRISLLISATSSLYH